MEPTSTMTERYGVAGALLGLFVWLIYTVVKDLLPGRQARGDALVDSFVAALTKAREEERDDRREEVKAARDHLTLLMNQQIEERRRERAEFYAVLDRLDLTLVKLSAKIDAQFSDPADAVVSVVPNPNLQLPVKP